MREFEQWDGFTGRLWKEGIDVRDFIQNNYTPYDGDASFLADATEATDKLWGELQELNKQARAKGGVLDMDTDIVSSITSHGPAAWQMTRMRLPCARAVRCTGHRSALHRPSQHAASAGAPPCTL